MKRYNHVRTLYCATIIPSGVISNIQLNHLADLSITREKESYGEAHSGQRQQQISPNPLSYNAAFVRRESLYIGQLIHRHFIHETSASI